MGNRAFCSGSMCPKATVSPAGDNELFDDTSACDPAGTVFNETLEDLNEVDRLLLVFSSSSNLSAVRWLFVLGANLDACDTNGTTCLHAACRSGSLSVVRDFVRRDLPLDATDVAGWTALHVALFMGRRSVAVELMRSGADLAQRNARGLAPSDLCSDVWLREAIHACASHRHLHGLQRQWDFGREAEVSEDIQISSRLRFEPFFVPRASVLKNMPNPEDLQSIGVEIFNQRPGQGLAFLVSSGAVRDFPVELSNFLSENSVSLTQVGEFLGEDFSLSQTLRLEYINSVRLIGTGVVSCLAKVFKQFHIPSDMQKIDRLIDGVAQIWWRQHEQLREKEGSPPPESDTFAFEDDGREVEGLRLMKYMKNYDNLHQIMFSAVMLHWNLYAPLPPSQRVTAEQWVAMNEDTGTAFAARGAEARDLGEGGGADEAHRAAMMHIRTTVYDMVSQTFYPQLQIWSNRPIRQALSRPAASSGGPLSSSSSFAGAAAAGANGAEEAAAEGWALLVGGGFPSFAGASGTITYRHIRSILSETTSTAVALASPNVSRQMPAEPAPPGPPLAGEGGLLSTRRLPGIPSGEAIGQSGRQDWVWMSLQQGLLFLAPKPGSWAPYAYVHMRGVAVQTMDRASLIVTFAADAAKPPAEGQPGQPEPRGGGRGAKPTGLRCNGGGAAGESVLGGGEPAGPLLQLIFLLPDGRWQVLELPRLKVQVPDLKQFERWRQGLAAHCSMPDATDVSTDSAKTGADEANSVA